MFTFTPGLHVCCAFDQSEEWLELRIDRKSIHQFAVSLALSDLMGGREIVDLLDILFKRVLWTIVLLLFSLHS